MFMVSSRHVMLFVLLTADPRKSTWLDNTMTCLTSHIVCVDMKKQHVGLLIFTVHYANTAHSQQVSLSPLIFPLQQLQTCVWDVPSPFKIVLVNASKVNAEETAKVNVHFLYIH